MYNKIFTKILDSSIWLEDDVTRIVWITIIAAMDEDSFACFASVQNLANRARVSAEACAESVKILESPDKFCPEQEHEGRRIERVDGGWYVLNGQKYKQMFTKTIAREKTRQRVARWRNKKNPATKPDEITDSKETESVTPCNAENVTVTPCNGVIRNVTPSVSVSVSLSERESSRARGKIKKQEPATPEHPPDAAIPTWAEFHFKFGVDGIPEPYLREKFAWFDGNNAWLDQRGELKKYWVLVRSWWVNDRATWSENGKTNQRNAGSIGSDRNEGTFNEKHIGRYANAATKL